MGDMELPCPTGPRAGSLRSGRAECGLCGCMPSAPPPTSLRPSGEQEGPQRGPGLGQPLVLPQVQSTWPLALQRLALPGRPLCTAAPTGPALGSELPQAGLAIARWTACCAEPVGMVTGAFPLEAGSSGNQGHPEPSALPQGQRKPPHPTTRAQEPVKVSFSPRSTDTNCPRAQLNQLQVSTSSRSQAQRPVGSCMPTWPRPPCPSWGGRPLRQAPW